MGIQSLGCCGASLSALHHNFIDVSFVRMLGPGVWRRVDPLPGTLYLIQGPTRAWSTVIVVSLLGALLKSSHLFLARFPRTVPTLPAPHVVVVSVNVLIGAAPMELVSIVSHQDSCLRKSALD